MEVVEVVAGVADAVEGSGSNGSDLDIRSNEFCILDFNQNLNSLSIFFYP